MCARLPDIAFACGVGGQQLAINRAGNRFRKKNDRFVEFRVSVRQSGIDIPSVKRLKFSWSNRKHLSIDGKSLVRASGSLTSRQVFFTIGSPYSL
jgi:hypothetical protein